MTTTITVQAHCDADTTEVLVTWSNARGVEEHVLQDGDVDTFHVWDDKYIRVEERLKTES